MTDDDELNMTLARELKNTSNGDTGVSNFTSFPPTTITSNIVLAELNIIGVQLHQVANGKPVIISKKGELLAVRFLLKSSFKSPKSNYVIKNFALQVLAVGKEGTLKPEKMGVLTKVQKVASKAKTKTKPRSKEIQMKVTNDTKDIF